MEDPEKYAVQVSIMEELDNYVCSSSTLWQN